MGARPFEEIVQIVDKARAEEERLDTNRRDRTNRRRRGHYTRAGIVPLLQVFPYIGSGRREYCGKVVRVNGVRLKVFKRDGGVCYMCGLQATHFAIESSPGQDDHYHINLYALSPEGKEVLMTRDHVHPKSKEGSDDLDNAQTACSPCNARKSDKVVT